MIPIQFAKFTKKQTEEGKIINFFKEPPFFIIFF